jgi:putative FmdB family regulatory protein
MIVYDFCCQDCLAKYERLVQSSEVKTVVCPDCGGEATRHIPAVGLLRTNFHDSPKVKTR